jgi:DNA-binding NarL/FixJ family response regulator
MLDPGMVRVFHCDDSSAYRALLRAQLDGDRDLEITGEAPDIDEALEGVRDSQPDVVLLDLLDAGRDAVTEIAAIAPATRVVVLSGHPREYGETIRRNAFAYVEKDAPLEELRATVLRAAHRG